MKGGGKNAPQTQNLSILTFLSGLDRSASSSDTTWQKEEKGNYLQMGGRNWQNKKGLVQK